MNTCTKFSDLKTRIDLVIAHTAPFGAHSLTQKLAMYLPFELFPFQPGIHEATSHTLLHFFILNHKG